MVEPVVGHVLAHAGLAAAAGARSAWSAGTNSGESCDLEPLELVALDLDGKLADEVVGGHGGLSLLRRRAARPAAGGRSGAHDGHWRALEVWISLCGTEPSRAPARGRSPCEPTYDHARAAVAGLTCARSSAGSASTSAALTSTPARSRLLTTAAFVALSPRSRTASSSPPAARRLCAAGRSRRPARAGRQVGAELECAAEGRSVRPRPRGYRRRSRSPSLLPQPPAGSGAGRGLSLNVSALAAEELGVAARPEQHQDHPQDQKPIRSRSGGQPRARSRRTRTIARLRQVLLPEPEEDVGQDLAARSGSSPRGRSARSGAADRPEGPPRVGGRRVTYRAGSRRRTWRRIRTRCRSGRPLPQLVKGVLLDV